MKLICATILCLTAATSAQAADDTMTMTYSKQFGAMLASAACDIKTYPTSIFGADGTVSRFYDASTDDLHRCQYISEISDSSCIQSVSCQSYEEWTLANPAISPALPREAFLGAIAARQAAAKGQAN